jgi:hypothetical protein
MNYADWWRLRSVPLRARRGTPSARGRVVVVTAARSRFRNGKVVPASFFPPFARTLAHLGMQTVFKRGLHDLPALVDDRTCIICAANEERPEVTALERLESFGAPVFNAPSRARTIADKRTTNALLASRGITVPDTATAPGTRIFSNALDRSNAGVFVADGPSHDPSRHETRFVDTTVTVGKTRYYTSLRLLCVGPTIVHAWVRARPVGASPAVHSRDTPLDPGLLEELQARCIVAHYPRLTALASRLAMVLGPGFYAHDVLLERGSHELLVCETGWKFDDYTFRHHIAPIAQRLPSQRIFFDGGIPRRSARALYELVGACRAPP